MPVILQQTRRIARFLLCLAPLCAGPGSLALAETISWDGNPSQFQPLPLPGGKQDALAPSPSSPSGNTVTVNNPIQLKGCVLGGHSYHPDNIQAESSGNLVDIAGNATIEKSVYGGYASSGTGTATTSGNTVTVAAGTATIGGSVYGGYANIAGASGTATAEGNTVTLNGGVISGDVRGGFGMGGYSNGPVSASAGRNRVFVNGDTEVKGEILGGYAQNRAGPATAAENAVSISGGTVRTVRGGYVYSNRGPAKATGNSVSFSGGRVTGFIYGGEACTDNSPALAEGNTVTVSGGILKGDLLGGYAVKNRPSPGDAAVSTTAKGNTVIITGGTFKSGVVGGYSFNLLDDTGTHGTAVATENQVVIQGGTFEKNIYGGYARTADNPNRSTAIATHNSVTLSGSPVFGSSVEIYGGYVRDYAATSDFYTGNSLNVDRYYGKTAVASIANFQNYSFLVPSTLPSGSAYLRTGKLDLGASPRLRDLGVTNDRALPDGYSVDLIRSEATVTGGSINEKRRIRQGVIMEYDGIVTTTQNALNLTLRHPRASDDSRNISEGKSGTLILTAQGAQFVAFRGIAAAKAATDDIEGFSTFAIMEGGNSRYNTGSHVDVKNVSILAGVAVRARVPGGSLIIGPAFEAAYGDFEGHSGSIKGSGHGHSFGGALIGRYQHDSGAYLDASFRAGVSFLDYNSGLRNADGRSASYESKVPYYGLHIKPGWLWPLTEKATLDLSAAYLWTRVEGSTETLDTGDKVTFRNADSHRLRGGARFSYQAAQGFSPYLGAAYEYELDGTTRAGAYGYAFKAPSLKGGTGIGEAGLYWNAGPLFIDASVQGYTGVREGFGGSLMARLQF